MDYADVYRKSLRLLNVRFLSEGELRRKLKRYDADDAVVDAVIARLKEERFIDDARLARAVYDRYVQKRQYGRAYIVRYLKRRCLPVPDGAEAFDELDAAEHVVNRRFKNGAEPQKIARFLLYRGFSPSVIGKVTGYFL